MSRSPLPPPIENLTALMSVLEALEETTDTRSNDLEARPEKELTEEELFSKLKKIIENE